MSKKGPPFKHGPRRPPWRDRSHRFNRLNPGTKFNVTAAFTEVWAIDNASFQISQAFAEPWVVGSPSLQVSTSYAEVWQSTSNTGTNFVVTSAFVEVWWGLPYVPPPSAGVLITFMGG